MLVEFVFWTCLVGAVYSYFIYPALLSIVARLAHPRPLPADPASGTMSVIIAARNEQDKMAAKIENTLALDPPEGGFEVLVASDASDDATDEIVLGYANRGVRLVRSAARLGKEHAQSLAIQASRGSILVFSDAGTVLPQDSLCKLAAAFRDQEVGAVSSVDRFLSEGGEVQGEGMYVRYEMWLRSLESRVAGLVGLSGSFFAARRRVCEGWDTHLPSDFNTALNCARSDLRAISDPEVLGIYQNLADPSKEYRRKVRTVIRGVTAVASKPDVLNPFRFGLFAWQVWSHKVMRWAVPFFLVLLLGSSVLLSQRGGFYLHALAAQVGFYAIALITHLVKPLQANAVLRLVYFFTQVNVSILEAVARFAMGQRMTTWQPSRR